MDRAAIVVCPIMVVGVVMLCGTAQPSIQRNARRFMLAPPGEVDRVGRCRLWVKSRHWGNVRLMSALPPKADIHRRERHVRFVPKADILHCGKKRRYSITSSARESSAAGTSSPSTFAVLRLITSLNFVDCTTGRSAGLVPLRIRPT